MVMPLPSLLTVQSFAIGRNQLFLYANLVHRHLATPTFNHVAAEVTK